MMEKKPNHLIKENSPYLLQHAWNPVDWHPWDENALAEAVENNKLLVISIGYAACHWCHVMEHESFEDEEVAQVMNRHFISVKVDREERPDVDHVYMTAAYATSGRGGWPLNVIALPDQRPVFAGTYYSKRDWIRILDYFSELYQSHPEELIHQANEIGSGMKKVHHLPFQADPGLLGSTTLNEIFNTWEEDLDLINGGTYGAPKFPMPANLSCLLAYGIRHKNRKAVDYVRLTLDKMACGGIYDHLGGGFSRYSVDAAWRVPHFEKMLYDNAQLISLYAQAFTATRQDDYKKVVEESVAFIDRELTSADGLFLASIDADSDGTEGAFYAWTQDEIRKYLGDDCGLFLEYYSCRENGNWEHQLNVLSKSVCDEEIAVKYGLTADQVSSYLDVNKNQLFTVRSNRNRPATDDKILTCWNALMISALTDSARALNKPVWLEKAVTVATWYRENLISRNGKLWRNSKAGSFAIAGFLDDYCFLIKAFLDIYQATFDISWLAAADLLTKEVILHFTAEDGIFFRLSSDEAPRLIQETVELSDNVIPASNSQMSGNLFVLGHLLNHEAYVLRAELMLKKMVAQVKRNPAFHANWAMLLDNFISGPVEVKITGNEKLNLLREFSGYFLPGVIFSCLPDSMIDADKSNTENGRSQIFICQGKTCFNPVETVQEAVDFLRNN
jgi:uncharacterized protein YyaL (SSP411 family)